IIASAPLSSTPNTQITFGSGTLVASLEDPGNNVVQNLTNLSLVVGTPTPTPTSTPTPTRTPTPTFTNTPTPTFTNTPTPTIALRPDLTVFIPSAGVVGNSLMVQPQFPLVPLLGCIQLTARQVDVLTRIIH
ncbi:MAG: Chitinase, partial [Candidatus Woesebacteria bacterium GW2011_GWA1_37_8]